MKITILVAVLMMSGCMGAIGLDGDKAGAGGASYHLTHTATDGTICEVSVVSGRDIQGGSLTVDKNCSVHSSVESTQGTKEALDVMNNMVNLGREALSKIPK